MTVTIQDERLLMWAAERLKGKFDSARCRWLAFIDDQALRAVVIYHDFSERSCAISIATDGTGKWCLKGVLKRIFDYPFVELGYRRVSILVSASNERSAKLVRGLGAVQEGELREATEDGENIRIFGMLAGERRF